MSCGKPCIIKIFLALLFVNFFIVSIYYFRHSPSVRSDPNFPTEDRGAVVKEFPSPDLPNNKPWPSLPSLLPWIVNPNLNSKSCEAYFGNGFTKRIDVLQTSNSGWFRCFYSETLKSSICEGGVLRMNPERIRMSAGGETLESVVGRTEAEEMPVFSSGAFEIRSIVGVRKNIGDKIMKEEDLNRYVPSGAIEMHTMRSLLDSIRIVGSEQFNCSQWIENPTLLVTRFEYANLFHTMTDWYSAYVASRITGLPSRPHVVFVDGHCKAPLEETWEALFSSLKYAKSFTGPVCFRHAILSPLGYETALFKGLTESINCKGAPVQTILKNPEDARTARLTEFGEMIRYSFGFDPSHKRIRLQSVYNILFVRREDYLAHPRHSGKVQSRLSNEQEVFDSLKSWIPSHLNCKTNLVNGLFAHMTMKDQIQAIQDASVIIGAHGAGLTHIIAALPDTVVLEIISSEYRRPHFSLISEWRGLDYHAIHLSGSYADPNIVIDKFGKIMRSLGC